MLESVHNLCEVRDLSFLFMHSNGPDKPISTCMLKVTDLTVKKILSSVIRVLQSKDEIQLDAKLNTGITTIHVDVGRPDSEGH